MGHDDTALPDPREAELAERGRALIAAAVAETRAPLALRERIEGDRTRAARTRRRGLLARLGLLAGAVAAAAVAIVLATGGAAPTVVAAAALAGRGAELPAPATSSEKPGVLEAESDGVAFPVWDDLAWKTTGARDDELEGRDSKTVFYEGRTGAEAAYTIVAGDALDAPAGADVVRRGPVDYRVLRDDGRTIVTWERDGHTCVLSAPAQVPADKLVELAAWQVPA